MSVPRWTTITVEAKAAETSAQRDGYEWTIDFHKTPVGRLQGWQHSETKAYEEAEAIATIVRRMAADRWTYREVM